MAAFPAPPPWTARPMPPGSGDGWEVAAASMVDGAPGKGAPVAVHLTEADAKLIASVHAMRRLIDSLREWADDHSDVKDGDDGQPEPNDAMRIQGEIGRFGL